MKDALKKLIIKHGGTYNRYDNTEKELLQRLCDALDIPYDRYMSKEHLWDLIAEQDINIFGGSDSPKLTLTRTAPRSSSTLSVRQMIPSYSCTYKATNGKDYYFSTDTSDTFRGTYEIGLFHIDLSTGVISKIYDTGYGWKYFFEMPDGSIYVSSSNSNTPGVLHIINKQVSVGYSKGYAYTSSIHTTTGALYISGTSGVLKIEDGQISIISSSSYSYFLETSSGDIFLWKYASSGNVSCIRDNVLKTILTSATYPTVYESPNCDIYIGTRGDCYYIDPNLTCTKIFYQSMSGYLNKFITTSTGDTYVCGNSSSRTGIYYINKLEYSIITTEASNYNIFEASDGTTFLYGYYSYVYIVQQGAATAITSTTLTYQNVIEVSPTEIYLFTSNQILYYNGNTAISIGTSGSGGYANTPEFNLFTTSKGYKYVGEREGIYFLDKENSIFIDIDSSYWEQWYEDTEGRVFVCNNKNGVCVLDGTAYTRITPSNLMFGSSTYTTVNNINGVFEKDGIAYFVTTNEAKQDSCVVEIKDGVATIYFYQQ